MLWLLSWRMILSVFWLNFYVVATDIEEKGTQSHQSSLELVCNLVVSLLVNGESGVIALAFPSLLTVKILLVGYNQGGGN